MKSSISINRLVVVRHGTIYAASAFNRCHQLFNLVRGGRERPSLIISTEKHTLSRKVLSSEDMCSCVSANRTGHGRSMSFKYAFDTTGSDSARAPGSP